MSIYTAGLAVDRCLNVWLLGTYSTQMNALSTDITQYATEIPCSTVIPLGEIAAGSMLAIDDELMMVIERDTTNNRCVVVRGIRGTTAALHASRTPIEINPRFPRTLVRAVMQQEIESWPETLYKVKSFTAAVASNGGTIAVPAAIDDFVPRNVISLRRASLSGTDSRYRRPDRGYEVEWDLLDTNQIMLNGSIDTATTYAVRCACKFQSDLLVDDVVDLVDTVGLSPGMVEILELGASYRMLYGRGAVRLFPEAEGQSRAAAEVGATDLPRFANGLLNLRDAALARESERLYRKYGFGGS